MNFKKILVIINPISGYSRSREMPFAIRNRLEAERFQVELYFTRGPGDGRDYVRSQGRLFDLVLVCGGDGTIREVAEGLSCQFIPMTIFPSGTENLFAKEMGIARDVDQLVQTIKWGRKVCLDMGQVNDRRYLLLSGIGFDAEVLLHLNRFRTGNISHFTYFWPIWRTFWEYTFPPITVEADGERLVENARGLVFVTNISRYAVNLRICKNAVFNDGLLDVCIYLCDHQIPLLGHAWRTVWGRHIEHPGVVYRQAKSISVSSLQKVPFETDGDPAGMLPARYSVVPCAINVVLPPG